MADRLPGERDIPEATVKTLFAFSRNLCAFRDLDTGYGCEQKLTDPSWKRTNARIAHIRGRLPRSERYDPTYPDPHAYENLILLCPNHHATVDDLEPDRYPPEVLEGMKARHEGHAAAQPWGDEDALTRFASMLIVETHERWRQGDYLYREIEKAYLREGCDTRWLRRSTRCRNGRRSSSPSATTKG